MKSTIVIDGTPLLGSSRHRGIGRVVYDLLHGFEEIRDRWADDLDLRVVTDLGVRRAMIDRPAEAAEVLLHSPGKRGRGLVRFRRLLLDGFAASAGAKLLHVTEALGTPLTRRVPRLVTCHDLIPLQLPREYLMWGPQRWTRHSIDMRRYSAATRLVAISERTRRDMARLLELGATPVDVVPNGIDLAHWSPTVRPSDAERLSALGLSRPFVLYAGYFDHRKDVPAMMRAVAEARRSVDVELVWAGHFSERDQRQFHAFLRREGLLDELTRVRFVGFVTGEDLAVLYRHAVAHLFLSRLEGFGISVVEALSAGCPAIVARDSGADEVGGDAVTVVDQGDHAAAARAIVELHRGVSKEARERGFARARTFSRAAMATGYIDAYRRSLR